MTLNNKFCKNLTVDESLNSNMIPIKGALKPLNPLEAGKEGRSQHDHE